MLLRLLKGWSVFVGAFAFGLFVAQSEASSLTPIPTLLFQGFVLFILVSFVSGMVTDELPLWIIIGLFFWFGVSLAPAFYAFGWLGIVLILVAPFILKTLGVVLLLLLTGVVLVLGLESR